MRIPPDARIPEEKVTRYLLTHREHDDKSRFLALAGFTQENPEELLTAIRNLADDSEAIEEDNNEYGTFYRVEGGLRGPLRSIDVVTIWIRLRFDGEFRFVTLKPRK